MFENLLLQQEEEAIPMRRIANNFPSHLFGWIM